MFTICWMFAFRNDNGHKITFNQYALINVSIYDELYTFRGMFWTRIKNYSVDFSARHTIVILNIMRLYFCGFWTVLDFPRKCDWKWKVLDLNLDYINENKIIHEYNYRYLWDGNLKKLSFYSSNGHMLYSFSHSVGIYNGTP